MANSDKNIRITPNRDTTSLPRIAFTGSTNAPITLYVLDDNTLSFEGSSGQLFSVNNNLSSGYIFSINDISGIPSFRVHADGTVGIAEFSGNVGIGITNPSYKLHIVGQAYATGGFVGNLTGTATSAQVLQTNTDTTSTLYLLGSRSSTGFAGTSIYVDSGISALGNTITATTFSGNATTSTSAGTAGTATNAGSAGTSISAGTAGTATNAGSAGTSVSAGTAGTATNAGFAGAATTATSAGTAGTATNAGFAGAATTATSAGTAGTATNAGSAGTSVSAGTAGTATNAGSAGTAVNAGFAGAATTATSSGTAGTATNAGSAGTSVSAGTAGTATNAGSAGTSVTAGSAGTAVNAGSAGTATVAGSVTLTSDSTNAFRYLTFASATSGSSNILVNSNLSYNPSAGQVLINSSTASTSVNTGALVVNGGVGISGKLVYNSAQFGTTGIASPPTMAFIGSTGNPINLRVLDDNTISFSGTQGQLFSISPILNTGWIFSVNDISGIPLIRANADATIAMAEYAGNVGIGLSQPSYKLHVAGDINASTGYTYRINGTRVLDSTTLGTGVVNSSLTSVGTLTSGTWNATTIGYQYGGTGYTTYAKGDLLVGTGSSLLKLGIGTSNQILRVDTSAATGLTWSDGYAATYGTFYSTSIQQVTAANTATLITFNGTYESNKVNRVGGGTTSQIQILTAGVYNVQFSAQINLVNGNQPQKGDIWFRVNGNNVPQSNTSMSISGKDYETVLALNFVSSFAANDYLELVMSSADLNFSIHAESGLTSPTRPDIPSIILSVTPVVETVALAGVADTGIFSINGLNQRVQYIAIGTTGNLPNIVSDAYTHTINIPLAGTGVTGTISPNAQTIAGDKTFSGNLSVTGNLTINGTTTTVNSTVSTIVDPVITIGGAIGNTNPSSDDNKDRGIEFKYFSGTAKTGFFGFDDSTGYFTFIPDSSNSSEVFSGTTGVIDATRITGSASSWTTARTLSLAGDLSGSVTFDGTGNTTLTATIAANSVALGTDTTGNYVADVQASGTGISIIGSVGEGATLTVNSNATSSNTVSTIVARDSSGNFSAGTITATTFSGNATTATSAGTAGTATNAGSAGTSVTAGSAGTAVNAGSAGTATVAGSVTITSDSTNASRYLSFTSATSGSSNILTNANLFYNPSAGQLVVNSSTASTSVNTGALVVNGGVGVSGKLVFNSAQIGTTGISTIPSMAFIGQTGNPIFLNVLEDNSLSFDGAQGQLFSITPVLNTGWIFSVNDISGIPLIRANADATISMAQFAGNVGIGISNPSYKLHVVGDINASTGYTYRINGTKVLDAVSLGSAVVSSSLTSVGTLSSGTWNATTIGFLYGGTGQTSYTDGQLLIGSSTGNSLIKSTLTAGSGILISNSTGSITISTTGAGITNLNGVAASYQSLAVGSSGTDFAIVSTGSSHTFNIPDASATARGLITTGTQTIAGSKTFSSTITGSITGSAGSATTATTAGAAGQWIAPITFSLGGDLSGSVTFSGSGSTTLTATIAANSVALGTDTTGNYAGSVSASGTGISIIGSAGEGTDFTVVSNATATNTASTIVARDSSGNFSAGTITATTFSGNATTATTAGSAGTAVNAGSAGTSVSAGTAGTATNAGSAGTSVSAGTAGTATNAGSAGTSVTAGSAGTATNAANTNIVLDTTSTIYITGSRSNASIGSTAVYVLSGVSALGNTITATTFSGNATTATTAGSAGTATNAGSAGSATTATNAGSAGTSVSAGTAGTATNAGTAGTATNAGSAGTSVTAGSAGTATNAANVNVVLDTTSTIYLSGSRSNASIGSTPVYILSGVSALGNTLTATTFSGNATTATTAGSAGTAVNAGSAGTSVSAGTAGTATNAGSAGSATTATSAGTAGTATNAGSAGTSVSAGTAGTATNAGSAGTSVTAGSAGTATNSANTNIVLDTATTIYLTGSRSNASIGSTPVYVLSGVSALGNTITATTFSGNATTSTTAGSAGTAINAGSAGSATTATSAGTAGTATNAGSAGTSVTAGSAGTAVNAGSAGIATTATSAGTAGTATNAGSAGTSVTAGSAGTATNAANTNIVLDTTSTIYLTGSRSNASIASTAVYVLSGVSALGNTITATTFSGNATTATTAGSAGTAVNAGSAGSATTATNAGSAGTSVTAGSAGTAVNAGSAGSATTATNAGSAGTSVTAGSAGTAVNAGSAGSATTSTNAGSAGTAVNAGSAGTATNSGRSEAIRTQSLTGVNYLVLSSLDTAATSQSLFVGSGISVTATSLVIPDDTRVGNNTNSSNTSTGALIVSGGVGITGNLNVGGNFVLTGDLTVNGTTTTVNSTVSNIVDPIITIGTATGGTVPNSADSKDRGVAFYYFSGTGKTGFFGWDQSASKYALYTDASISGEIVSGTKGTLFADLDGNAGSATTATSAGTAGTATNAGSAGTSVTAGSAGTAVNAGSAGSATTATSAGTAGTATNAGSAGTSVSAGTAGTATNAGSAGTSVSAGTAGTATNSANTNIVLDTTSTIYLTGSRSNASIGSTPVYVLSGVSALGNTITATTFSGNATTATTAGSAGTAVNSGNAGSATTATSAGTAGTATNAGAAGSATTATNAGSAGTSVSAGTAGTATNAGSAGTSVSAGTAGTATNAGLAGTATNAANTNIVLDTTSTIYLTGSRSNASIGSTAVYVLSGVSALGNTITATTFSGNATTATSAGSAGTSVSAGTAGTATNAGSAGTSITAGSAGSATTATSAGTAGTATNAGSAGTSVTAGSAGTAVNAGSATTATSAGSAGTANNSANINVVLDTTSTIYLTGSRSNASIGSTPSYVLSGVSALGNTITATTFSGNATTATTAGSAGTAVNAGSAGSATTATSAGSAGTSVSAGTAGTATNAGSAGTSVTAGSAGTAVNAGSAGSATTATNAGTAGTATNAGSAGTSVSAGTAGTATNAGLAGTATNAANTNIVLDTTTTIYLTGSRSNASIGSTAVYVLSGVSALGNTITATTFSGNATTATTAGSAGTAVNAGSAGSATTATNAGFAGAATTATNAGSAGTSVSSGTAGTATNAGSAGTSVSAGTAGTATNAGSAGTATNSANINVILDTTSNIYLTGSRSNASIGSTPAYVLSGVSALGNTLTASGLNITGTTASTGFSTGAVTVHGGLGVSGNINTSGVIKTNNTSGAALNIADRVTVNTTGGFENLNVNSNYSFAFNVQDTANNNRFTIDVQNNRTNFSGNSAAHEIRFYHSNQSTYTGFKANSSGTVTYTWPGGDGTANQVLYTNGSGGLGWTTVSSAGTSGLVSLNGITASTQTFAVGTSGSEFNISSTGSSHTFNIPYAGAASTGLITIDAQTIAGTKTFSSTISGSITGNAGSANTATTAGSAGTAVNAGSAGSATTATSAGTAGTATNAGSAGTSVTAGSATTATNAGSAGTSVSAGTAGTATNAGSAGTSVTAGSAGTANNSANINVVLDTTSTIYLTGSRSNASIGATAAYVLSGVSALGNTLSASGVNVTGATTSTGTGNGALVVTGGVGIGGSLWTAAANLSSISGVTHLNGAILSGAWAGTAISAVNGGTGQNTYATGDILYASSSTALTRLAAGAAGSVLYHSGTAPYWSSAPTGSGGGAGTVAVGTSARLAYYPGTGSSVKDATGFEYSTSGTTNTVRVFGGSSIGNTFFIVNGIGTSQIRVGIGVTNPAYELEIEGEISATNKSFVINHPLKPDWKLRYGSLEGPENGVYVRGILKDEYVIETPDYWTGLVDPNSFTVTLTPIGKSDSILYVEKIEDYKVFVNDFNNNPINCFFTVWAERIDIPKLVVEYENGTIL